MANQYTKLTKTNILAKVNRKKNPVTSIAQLAREFGYDTFYYRWSGRFGTGTAAPRSFRNKVKALVGEKQYNEIRESGSVNLSYR